MKRILYVYVKGGAPIDHAFPRIAACGQLHVLALSPLPDTGRDAWEAACSSITTHDGPLLPGDDVVEVIVSHARRIRAEAVLTLSEFAVLAVARAAAELGLAGAGDGILAARDKRLMREAWAESGVPIPRFRRVETESDLHAAVTELRTPVLLKPAWGAGSVAQLVLDSPAQVPSSWSGIRQALGKGREVGMNELYEPATDDHRLVEEIVTGSTDGWYEQDGYGDYLSVEGIVAKGVHHPISITAKLPPIPPYIEIASMTPCVLPERLQRRIEEVTNRAVDALGLDTCGTHTELKLMADGEVAVIETAARFGGLMTTRQIEDVFGLDPIGMLVRELLGEPVDYPQAMLVDGNRAVASLAVVPANSQGVPWRTRPTWSPDSVNWAGLLSPGSTAEPIRAFTLPEGTRVPAFDPSGGSRNWLGIFLLTAPDADTLHRDCRSVLDGFEAALAAATRSPVTA